MKCPIDDTTLVMTERSGIEIDYCPECRGVWLDRGELDRLIQASKEDYRRSDGEPPHGQPLRHNAESHEYEHERSHHDYRDEDEYGHGDSHYNGEHAKNGKKRRGSFLEDVFGGFGGD